MKVRLSILIGALFAAISLISESWKPIAQQLILIFNIRQKQLHKILITSDIVFIGLTLLIFIIQKIQKCSIRNCIRRSLTCTGLVLSCLVLSFGIFYWKSQSTFTSTFITAILGGILQSIAFIWLLQFLQAGLLQPISVILIWYLAPNISLLFGKIIGSQTVSNSRRPHKNFQFFEYADFQKNFAHFKDLIIIGVGIGIAIVMLLLLISYKKIRQSQSSIQTQSLQSSQQIINRPYLKKFAFLAGIIVGLQYATDLQTQIVHYRFAHLNYSHVDMKHISALADFLLVSFIVALLMINRKYEDKFNKTNTIYAIAIITLWTQFFWIFYLKYGNLSIFGPVLHRVAIAIGFINRMFISILIFPISNQIKRLMKQQKTRFQIITIFSLTLIIVKTISYIFMTYSLHVFLFVFFFVLTVCFSLLHILLSFKNTYKTLNEQQQNVQTQKDKSKTDIELNSQQRQT